MNILLTGATGYIGGRLKERLLEDKNVQLRLFLRNPKKIRYKFKDRVQIAEGNTLDKDSLQRALEGIDIAYYLIHSMGAKADFEKLDRLSAQNFLEACIANGVKRIVYLGGLGDRESASKHLRSRIETGEILSSYPDEIQTIWIRAGVIIGSGSASFEIIRHLVQKLPAMTTPKWVHTKTQPIGVDNVLEYLYQAKDLSTKESLVVDIGSAKMSFREMLQRAARTMDLKRWLLPVPFLTPRLSSYWLKLMTPVPFSVARSLIQGLKSETVVQNENAEKYFPQIVPLSYEESFKKALEEIIETQVIRRKSDGGPDDAGKKVESRGIESATFRETFRYDFGSIPAEKIFTSIQSIGGDSGWFRFDLFWRLRGSIDKVLGGSGLNRGRRDPRELRMGDTLDFWKVVDLKPSKRILLVNQMKVPGIAWLEFIVEGTKLIQTAHFYPKGLWGRIYWYLTMPLHKLVFPDIAKGIIRRASEL
jgi:uncharacterized protein YbjT (DUF2867 family)